MDTSIEINLFQDIYFMMRSTIAYSTPATESTATLTSALTVTISSPTTPSISTTTPSKD